MNRVRALEGKHINGEDVICVDPSGCVRGVYYATPDEWEDGECVHYSKYVPYDFDDDSLLGQMRLDDWCIAKSDDDSWYICNHWDVAYAPTKARNELDRQQQ